MNLIETFGITHLKIEKQIVLLKMPITDIHKQPFGMVHGGLYATLIETAASLGGMAQFEDDKHFVVGVDIQVNHLKSTSEGILYTEATPNHVGRTIQVWQGKIYNEKEELIAVGRCTLASRAR